MSTPFHPDHGRRCVFCTINRDGRDAPRAWLGILDNELCTNPRHGKCHLCREVGKGKEQERHHWVVETDMADTDESHELHRELLNATGCRIQSKTARANAESSVEGLLEHLSKDLGKRTFDWKSNCVAAADVIENDRLHEEEHPEAWADGLVVLQPTDVLAWCKSSAKVNGTTNVGGFGNQMLWGIIWERNVTFHSEFYTAPGGAGLDPVRSAIQWRVMHETEAVDEVDCATMLFGNGHVCMVTANQCHGERHCPGRAVFDRDLNALKRKQALDRSVGGALETNLKRIKDAAVDFARGIQRQERLGLDSLKDWQLKSWLEAISHAPKRHHRHLRWHHESAGNAGKSHYLAFLAQKALTCLLASDNERDCLCALAQWMDAHDGHTPHVVAFDFARADAANAPCKLMEMLSNGFACNLKRESRVMRLAKCHVLVMSNSPPAANAPVSADRWHCDKVTTVIDLRNNDQGHHVADHGTGSTDVPAAATPAAPATTTMALTVDSGDASPIIHGHLPISATQGPTCNQRHCLAMHSFSLLNL